jgi:hypothetical protein
MVSILEQARSNVARSVNINMVIAYWLIGREIVEDMQKGEKRAEYGKKILQELSIKLTDKYKKGFSETSLQYFRKFYLAYAERVEISRHAGVELNNIKSRPNGVVLSDVSHDIEISSLAERELQNAFSPNLSWSHYRALMRVKNCEARNFYEKEAEECSWSKKQLERQIHSSYYERIISNKGKEGLLAQNRERLKGDNISSVSMLKSPLVLEFLGIPDSPSLHEAKFEDAIITHLL